MLRTSSWIITGLTVAALGLSSCHFSNGEYGPASPGAPKSGGSSTGEISYGNGYGGTNTKLLGSSSNLASHPNIYDGAGFKIPNYPPTTLAGWIQGLPLNPSTLSWRSTSLGPILTTNSGQTLYIRLGDAFRHSGCFGTCARAFPPFLTNGAPMATGGLLAANIGVLAAATKGEQVAYGGHPLYTYSGDTSPGDINAQGAGNIWYVISTSGLPVLKAPVSSASSTTSTTLPLG